MLNQHNRNLPWCLLKDVQFWFNFIAQTFDEYKTEIYDDMIHTLGFDRDQEIVKTRLNIILGEKHSSEQDRCYQFAWMDEQTCQKGQAV